MKSVDATEAQARLDEILDEVQQQPFVMQRQGQDVAAILSIANYERLRAVNIQVFLDLRSDVAGEAAASGLTEDTFPRLLRDDDT